MPREEMLTMMKIGKYILTNNAASQNRSFCVETKRRKDGPPDEEITITKIQDKTILETN